MVPDMQLFNLFWRFLSLGYKGRGCGNPGEARARSDLQGTLTTLSNRRRRLSSLMRLEKGMDLSHGQRNPLFRLFPGEDAHFGFRREHHALHGDGVRVR